MNKNRKMWGIVVGNNKHTSLPDYGTGAWCKLGGTKEITADGGYTVFPSKNAAFKKAEALSNDGGLSCNYIAKMFTIGTKIK